MSEKKKKKKKKKKERKMKEKERQRGRRAVVRLVCGGQLPAAGVSASAGLAKRRRGGAAMDVAALWHDRHLVPAGPRNAVEALRLGCSLARC